MILPLLIIFSSLALSLSAEEQQELYTHKQHKKREAKRPDLQLYRPAAGHGRRHRDSEEGESSPNDSLKPKLQQFDESSQSENRTVSENVFEKQECTNSGSGMKKGEEDRMRGEGGNVQPKTNANDEKVLCENDQEHQEPAEAKTTKKARKPDREFYRPGSRRNNLGKDSGVLDKPPPRKQKQNSEPEPRLSTGTREGNVKKSIPKQEGKSQVKGVHESVKSSDRSENARDQGNQNVETPVDASVDKMTNKIEKLALKDKGKTDHVNKNREGGIDKQRRGQAEETKDEQDKADKKREKGSRRKRGVEQEKEKNPESKREDEAARVGKTNRRKPEKEKDKTAPDADGRKPERAKETQQSKRKDNGREYRKINVNNSSRRDGEKDAVTDGNLKQAAGRMITTTPSLKRYSKSDVRHLRNRTYSSSSASSVTSQDGARRQVDMEGTKWPRRDPSQRKTETTDNNEEKRRHLQSWTSNKDSSSESLDRMGTCDREEDRRRRRRRRGGEEEMSTERQNEEGRAAKSSKGGGRGILRVPLEKQSSSSAHGGDAQSRKQAPRGRGGILVLPTRTDISNSPEVGQRLLPGGIRGGGAGRNRGGRGGGVRRLWDPNNPDQKPALSGTQTSQYSSLKQPVYLQTGTGYGQLHFLDTDDEVAGSPPVAQGEHFQSQQAAAMAYYKFQNSDNPYCYPLSNSSPHNPTTPTSTRYPYPYMGPYQMGHPNGMYPAPGPFCGSYRGVGYSQPGAGGGLTPEEAEQQTRGELGRLQKAASAHELQLSNLLSRDRLSADGLDRMPQLR